MLGFTSLHIMNDKIRLNPMQYWGWGTKQETGTVSPIVHYLEQKADQGLLEPGWAGRLATYKGFATYG